MYILMSGKQIIAIKSSSMKCVGARFITFRLCTESIARAICYLEIA